MKKSSKAEDTEEPGERKIRFVESQFPQADKTIQGHYRTSSYSLIHMQLESLKHKQKAHLKKFSKNDKTLKSQI